MVGGHVDVEQAQARDLAELEEVARDRRQDVRQVVADIGDGKGDVDERGGEARASAVAIVSTRSTRARERRASSSVSPGRATKVPLDCSPAMVSATFSGAMPVSTR